MTLFCVVLPMLKLSYVVCKKQVILAVGCLHVCCKYIIKRLLSSVVDCRGWMVRICRVSDGGKTTADDEFQLPVFAFVFTKFRKLPDAKLVRFISVSVFLRALQR